MPVPLPRIGTATANLARTMAAPAVAPISSAISAVRNPMAAMDLPPVMAAAGGFARDASQMGQLSLPFGDRGMSGKKTGQQLDDIETNTDKTSEMLSDGIPTMVALLARIESNTRGPSEEEIMESKNKKGGPKAKKKGKGVAAGEDGGGDDFGLLDALGTVYLGKRFMGIITRIKGFFGRIFGKNGFFGRVLDFLRPSNLMKKIDKKMLMKVIKGGTVGLVKKIVAIPLAIFHGVAGFLKEITDPEAEGGPFRRTLTALLVGVTEALDGFLLGLLPSETINEFIRSAIGSIADWWETQDFKELWREWVPTMGDLAEGLGDATEWLGTLFMDIINSVKKMVTDYFTTGGGVGFGRAWDSIEKADQEAAANRTGIYAATDAVAAGRDYIDSIPGKVGNFFSDLFSNPATTAGLQAVAGAPMGLGAVPPMIIVAPPPQGSGGGNTTVIDQSQTTTQMSGAKPPVTPEPAAFGE